MLLLWRPLKMMLCHSWYLSQELETLSLFSHHLSSEEKAQLMSTMKGDLGLHLVQSLPRTIRELYISRSFPNYCQLIVACILAIPCEEWPKSQLYKIARQVVNNLACVNDNAELGVVSYTEFQFNKNEEQKQFLLQVVEKHRHDFSKCNRDNLVDM